MKCDGLLCNCPFVLYYRFVWSSEMFWFCLHSWTLPLDIIWLWNIRAIIFTLRVLCLFPIALPLASAGLQLAPYSSSAAWSHSPGRIQQGAVTDCKICTSYVTYHPLVHMHRHSVHYFLFPSGKVNCYNELVNNLFECKVMIIVWVTVVNKTLFQVFELSIVLNYVIDTSCN
jgi:hypothetical protein